MPHSHNTSHNNNHHNNHGKKVRKKKKYKMAWLCWFIGHSYQGMVCHRCGEPFNLDKFKPK